MKKTRYAPGNQILEQILATAEHLVEFSGHDTRDLLDAANTKIDTTCATAEEKPAANKAVIDQNVKAKEAYWKWKQSVKTTALDVEHLHSPSGCFEQVSVLTLTHEMERHRNFIGQG